MRPTVGPHTPPILTGAGYNTDDGSVSKPEPSESAGFLNLLRKSIADNRLQYGKKIVSPIPIFSHRSIDCSFVMTVMGLRRFSTANFTYLLIIHHDDDVTNSGASNITYAMSVNVFIVAKNKN